MARTDDGYDDDVVGGRVLVGLQTVHISRLSMHPIPISAASLIAVAGQGPKDSNGAGKSSLIGSASFIHADDQWRFNSGATSALDLLFTAEDAGQEGRWSDAKHGYIIGVFADPAADTLPTLQDSALTVWIRIDREHSPHVVFRWADGLKLPIGRSEADREKSADETWATLPKRGRRRGDLSAREMPRVLFGDHVRCVSFLSTSVRASATANLLAQPLNDLPAHRIFSAIAALTGLDREIEQERVGRIREHEEQRKVARAEELLGEWEEHARAIEASIDDRDEARAAVVEAERAWRSRVAVAVTKAYEEKQSLDFTIDRLADEITEKKDKIREISAQINEVSNDDEFQQKQRLVMETHRGLTGRERYLESELARRDDRIEQDLKKADTLQEVARDADGREEKAALVELETAVAAQQDAVKACGVAESRVAAAAVRLRSAEAGEDLAQQELHLLATAGIEAIAVADAVGVSDAQRARWEPILAPYRQAVVVSTENLDAAVRALVGEPGSVVVPAKPAKGRKPKDVPESTDRRFDLSGFLVALAGQYELGDDPERVTDIGSGAVIVGGFAEPTTGRVQRISRAEFELENLRDLLVVSEQRKSAADVVVRDAERRVLGSRAAEEVATIREAIETNRVEREKISTELAEVQSKLDVAARERDKMVGDAATRNGIVDNLLKERDRFSRDVTTMQDQRGELEAQRAQTQLGELLTEWGHTLDEAHTYVLSLEESHQTWSENDWWLEADRQMSTAIAKCFPDRGDAASPDNVVPSELRNLFQQYHGHGAGRAAQARQAFPALRTAVAGYLRQQETFDGHQRRQIGTERTDRHKDLEGARLGHGQATQAAGAYRSSLADAIKNRLKSVSDEFDRIDRKYGGYGASLHYPVPEAPSDPTQPWTWEVTPQWRRAEGKRLIAYNRRGNTAQMDEKAVKLVCAAAMAGAQDRPLTLILDELGRNLGKQHRREAVSLLGQIGADSGITVIGALQDDMERYAIDACGQYIKLRRSSDSMPYNEQPVIIGYEPRAARLELLRGWLTGNGYVDRDEESHAAG
ncbi:hypothetical protein GCM10009765_52990 [Fodinicola feengrottensis]|uniref:Chromosome segregation ATPase n=1 Tax=Fodinicola feengrottensis TaxID=435914 RepID=A0ABP4U3W8_9ACTN